MAMGWMTGGLLGITHGVWGAEVRLATRYQFPVTTLTVNTLLLPGTVVASATIPEGPPLGHSERRLWSGFWRPDGRLADFLEVPTDLPGLTLRAVVARALPPPAHMTGSFGGAPWLPLPLSAGGLRIELVKTGVVIPGVMKAGRGALQYRIYDGQPPRGRLLLVETLVLGGPLTVVVTETRVTGNRRHS
ncbi:TPA: hypothetical protein ACGQS5_004785 [Serratia liquefaciens]